MFKHGLKKCFAVFGAAVLCGAGASAVDIKANIMMRGDVARIEKDKATGDKSYSYLMNNPVTQKDNPGDALLLDFDSGIAGAHIAMWYNTATNNGADTNEEDDWTAHFRRTYAWFKPVDTLTVRLGYIGNDTFFKERIDEWKVGSPFAISERDWSKHPCYINCNDGEGWGMGFEYRPVDQLIFNAGITPGKKGAVADSKGENSAAIYKKDGDDKYQVAPWGAGVKYYWNNFEFQASYRNGGMDGARDGTWAVGRFGAGYSDENTYSFIQPILGFDYNKKDEKWEMNGICFDLYSEYAYDAWIFTAHLPVTLRYGDDPADFNYLEANFKVEYNTGSHGNMDDVTPYFQIGSNQDDAIFDAYKRAWILDSDYFEDSFNLSYKAGVSFKISKTEIDVGLKYDMLSDYAKADGKDWILSVPFTVKVREF